MKKRKEVSNKLKRLGILGCAIWTAGILTFACIISSKSDSDLKRRVVKLTSEAGMCSGEQVRAPSGVDYILSAAHCKSIADSDGQMLVETEDGNRIKRRIIQEDPKSDLLLIEGLPNLRGLDVAESRSTEQHIRTFTHGRNMPTYRTDGKLFGNVSVAYSLGIIETAEQEASCKKPKNRIVESAFFSLKIKICGVFVQETVTDALIVPGSSGGMAVDDSGKLVGVASMGGDGFGYLVRLEDIKAFLSGY
jgi:hypothetical protein